MKKYLLLMIVGSVLLLLAGCQKTDENVQIANPWKEYDTIAEAEAATNLVYTVQQPKMEGYEITLIQATDSILEVRYSNGDKQFIVRRANDLENVRDLAGDYNVYDHVEEKEVGAIFKATFEGNGNTPAIAYFLDATVAYAFAFENIDNAEALTIVDTFANTIPVYGK